MRVPASADKAGSTLETNCPGNVITMIPAAYVSSNRPLSLKQK